MIRAAITPLMHEALSIRCPSFIVHGFELFPDQLNVFVLFELRGNDAFRDPMTLKGFVKKVEDNCGHSFFLVCGIDSYKVENTLPAFLARPQQMKKTKREEVAICLLKCPPEGRHGYGKSNDFFILVNHDLDKVRIDKADVLVLEILDLLIRDRHIGGQFGIGGIE